MGEKKKEHLFDVVLSKDIVYLDACTYNMVVLWSESLRSKVNSYGMTHFDEKYPSKLSSAIIFSCTDK